MNLFLLGNGFDLSFDLPTKYSNFLHILDHLYKHYSNAIPLTLEYFLRDESLHEKDETIKRTYDKYKDVYDDIQISQEMYRQLMNYSDNLWFKYLINSFDEDLQWIDFEKEIARVLKAFYAFFKKEELTFSASFFSKSDFYIIRKFGFFIIDRGGTVHNIKKTYLIEYPCGSKNFIIDKEKIVEELFKSLIDFMEMLKIYLKLFVDEPLDKMIEKNLIESASNVFSSADEVITFNYTNTFEKIYKLEKVHHIHGKIDDKIVLGINPNKYDELDDIDTVFIQFKKYFQRIIYKTDITYYELIDRMKELYCDSHYNEVNVCGHSLDKTDSDIIKEVFSVCDKINIYYHNEQSLKSYVRNLIEIYGKTEFDELRNRTNLTFLPY